MLHLPPETEFLAQRLAAAHGLSPEDAIRMALEERAREDGLLGVTPVRDVSPDAIAARRARTNAFVARIGAMPMLDSRAPREIMDDVDSL